MTDTATTEVEGETAEAAEETTTSEAAATAAAEAPAGISPEALKRRIARAENDAVAKFQADLKVLAEREQMDAAERARAEKADSEKVSAEQLSAKDARIVASDVKADLLGLGVKPDQIKHALKLIELDGISPDDDDYDTAREAAAKKLIGEMPALAAKPAAGASGGEFQSDGDGKVWTKADLKKLTPDEYEKHEAAIQKQMQTIGIK